VPTPASPTVLASRPGGRAVLSCLVVRGLFVVLCLSLGARAAVAEREWYEYYREAQRLMAAGHHQQALESLRQAVQQKPNPALKEQTYGLDFIDYLPYYQMGICYLRLNEYKSAVQNFDLEEQRGAIKRSDKYRDLLSLRGEADNAERQRLARNAREELRRLLERGTDLARTRKYDEALAVLAQAEALAKGLDATVQRTVADLREKVRAEQKAQADAAARAQRIEVQLGEGTHLLEEGHPTEAAGKFEAVLLIDPANTQALEGKRTAQERIRATTTRQARELAFMTGKALFEAGRYAEALPPLTDAAADERNAPAQELLTRTRRILEGLSQQRELQGQISALFARGERLLSEGAFPEAQVAFEGVLRLDPQNVKARERMEVAELRTGEALMRRWLPNEPPVLTFFEPHTSQVDTPTVTVQGVAMDDRGVTRVRIRIGDRVLADIPAPPRLESGLAQRNLSFQREVSLEPGLNQVEVSAWDDSGLVRTEVREVTRRLRFYETSLFLPSAAATAAAAVGAGFLGQHLRRRRARRRRFNPYIAGAPVLDEEMFFGRRLLMTRILNVLHHNSLLITGERRIGKTTFLYHLKKVLENDEGTEYRFFPVLTDLQGVPETGFFHALMTDVVETLKPSDQTLAAMKYGAEPSEYDGRDFSHDLQRVIAELKLRTDRKVKLALLIDEVDVLNEYSEQVNQRLRGIFMKTFAESLVAVMSGVGIRRSWKSEGSPWYNFFDEMEIAAFTREEAEALIRQPVAPVFRWESEAVEAILDLSQLKPYQIQKYCVHAVNRMLEQGRSTIRREDVEAVMEKVLTESVAH
jgi:tetratricopeptide (TPR) repeat protein